MARTIIGLYDDYATAQRAVEALEERGFGSDHLHVTSNENDDSDYYTDPDEMGPDYLTKYGIPKDEADFAAEGVRRGGTLVVVRAHDADAEDAADIMAGFNPARYEQRAEAYRSEGFTEYDADADVYSEADRMKERERFADERAETAKIVEENLKVGKRAYVSGGARLHTYVVEKPVEESLMLRREHVDVERRSVDRPATSADIADAFEEKTIEMTEYTEEAVVEKDARVVEEVSLGKTVEQETETIRDTVRHTEVEITEDLGDMGETFRTHWMETLGGKGDFDQYERVYQFGYRSANDDRFRGKSYGDVESDVRADFGRDFSGHKYDDYSDAIRYGFDQYGRSRRHGAPDHQQLVG